MHSASAHGAHTRRSRDLGSSLQREHDARALAAGGHIAQRPQRLRGARRQQELHPVESVLAHAVRQVCLLACTHTSCITKHINAPLCCASGRRGAGRTERHRAVANDERLCRAAGRRRAVVHLPADAHVEAALLHGQLAQAALHGGAQVARRLAPRRAQAQRHVLQLRLQRVALLPQLRQLLCSTAKP